MSKSTRENKNLRMPQGSPFFEKVIPALLILMGAITAALILFAFGVLFGIVHF